MKHIRRLFAMLCCLTMLCGVAFARDYSSMIDTIFDSYTRGNDRAENVYQQIANGSYRTTEMLYVICLILDRNDAYSDYLDSVWDSYERGNDRAETVYQQIANGFYRSTEFLYFIATYWDR